MTSRQHVRQSVENPPPRIWDIPVELRRRLSARVGRQRSISVEDHLVIVLHRPPKSGSSRASGVYFWRSPEAEWFHSEQGSGFAALESLVEAYEQRTEDLERRNEAAESTKSWFGILDELGPLLRAARNLHDTLNQARDQTADFELRSQLQPLCDQASEIVRTAELLQLDVQNSIQYSIARQAELQAGFSRVQSVASHRLNILAAVFLPLATISSVFGMNLTSGIEHWPPLLFWFVMFCGIGLGTLIGVFVMNVRGFEARRVVRVVALGLPETGTMMHSMNIVLCFPVVARHVEQIQAVVPSFQVLNAGQERIAELLSEADIFCGHAKVPVPWDDVVAKGRLRWIQSSAAGLDHCLVPSVIASDIPVTSASGLFAPQVAEQTLAILLGMIRSMPTFYAAQRRREFVRRPTDDLLDKTVGIVGFGGNGRRIASVLSNFGVRLVATDKFPERCPDGVESLWSADELERLLATSDVVVLCVPLNEETHHMIAERELSAMRPGSLLINVARGPVVDEAALVQALQTGHLAGAGLDVTEVEPLAESSPLWDFDNVVITPHVGAQSAKRVDVTVDFFCQNLRCFLEGQPLQNLVDKRLGFPVPN